MSDDNHSAITGFSSVQVYTLSAICLLIGITMGYLFRGSNPSAAASAAAPTTMLPQRTSGNSAGPLPNNGVQPSAEDMKRMADKQVAPLLEQLKSNPNDSEILAKIAHYYMVARQFKDAAVYYDKSTHIKPTAERLTDLSNAYYYGGSADKAIETLNRALKIDPSCVDALYNLGMLKWEVQGDAKGAIACWQKLLATKLNDKQRSQVEHMIARAKEHAKMAAAK